MSQLIKLIDTATAVGVNAGAATTINGARCVMLTNKGSTGIATVAIAATIGAATSQYFCVPPQSTIFFQKKATDFVWAHTALAGTTVEANNVGFTN